MVKVVCGMMRATGEEVNSDCDQRGGPSGTFLQCEGTVL